METITVRTTKSRQVVDITREVDNYIKKQQVRKGLCHLFLLHTTAALTAADLDPGTDQDILDALDAMMPKLRYRHPHDPDHVTDHILACLIGPSMWLPVQEGHLVLGTWQRVVLLEFSGPREREIVVTLMEK